MGKSGNIGIGYTRKSLVYRRSDQTSIERQGQNVQRAIEADGLLPEMYSDAEGHRSGRNDKYRPAWRNVMRRIADSDVRCVYVDSLSRAYRSVKGWNELLERVKKYGVDLIVLAEGIDTRKRFGALAKGTSDLMAVVAEIESTMAAERMTDSIAYLKSRGVYWGQSPFGYKRIGEGLDARLIPFPPHDETIRTIFVLWSTGMSHAKIASELNRRGVRFWSRKNEPVQFTCGCIRTIVNSVLTYAGYVLPKGAPAKARQVRLAGLGSLIERYACGMEAVKGQVTPLIDEATASAAVDRWINKASPGRKCGAYIHILSGRVFYRGVKLRSQNLPYGHFYRTYGRGGRTWDAEPIDNLILDKLRGVRFPESLRQMIRAEIENNRDKKAMAQLQQLVDKLSARLNNLERMRADGEIGTDAYRNLRHETEVALFETNAKLTVPSTVDEVMTQLTQLAATLDRATPVQRQSAVALLVKRVDINDAGEIIGGLPQDWAGVAFGELARALQIVPSTSVEEPDCNTLSWLVERLAA